MKALRFRYLALTLLLILVVGFVSRPGSAMQDCAARDYTYTIAFSPDGERILAGWDWGTIRLWDVQSGQILRDFAYDTDHTFSVAFTPDSKYVLAGGYTGAYMWDMDSGEFVRTFPAQINLETDIGQDTTIVKITPDSRFLLTSTAYGARLWNLQTGDELLNLTSANPNFFGGDLSRDGRYVLVGHEDGVRLWDAETGSEVHYFGESSFKPTFSDDGRFMLVGTQSGVELWETAPLRHLDTLTSVNTWNVYAPQEAHLHTTPEPMSGIFAPDGKHLLIQTENQTWVWDSSTEGLLTLRGIPATAFSTWHFAPDSIHTLTSAGSPFRGEVKVSVWNVETGAIVSTFADRGILEIVFSPDSRYIATGGLNSQVRLWDARTGREARTFC